VTEDIIDVTMGTAFMPRIILGCTFCPCMFCSKQGSYNYFAQKAAICSVGLCTLYKLSLMLWSSALS